MQFKEIHNYLYEKHYLNYNKSSVVSSHWDNYFKKFKIEKKNNKFIISSIGLFSQAKNKIDLIKILFIKINLYFFIKKYKLNKKIVQNAKKLNKIIGVNLTFDVVKNFFIYDILNNYSLINNNKTICVIGDGYGYLGQLIKYIYKDIKIIYINLGINLFIDSYLFSLAFKKEIPLLLNNDNINQIEQSSVIFLEAENMHLLKNIDINLFISVASMQEMNFSTINNYFEIFRQNNSQSFFYCCNRVSKKLNDATIINFDDYPWNANDKIIFEEDCEWYSKYPTYLPFYWKPFEGKVKHKLVKIVNLKNELHK